MKRTYSWLVVLLVGLSVSLVWTVTLSHPAHLNWSPWAYSEWLINYDGGFIRRGMGGELIDMLVPSDHVAAVNLLVFANYAALSALLLWAWRKTPTRSAAAMALAVLVPGGLFQMAVGNAFFFRKEIVFHIALGVDCLLYSLTFAAATTQRRNAWAGVLIAFFAAQSVFLPLVHEAYLFISYPAAWLIANRVARLCPERPMYRRIVDATIGLEVVLFSLCAMFKGNADVVNHMWHAMSAADRLLISQGTDALPSGGISAIGWSTMLNLSGVFQMFFAGEFWIWGLAGAGIAGVLVLVTAWSVARTGANAATAEGAEQIAHDAGLFGAHLRQLGFLFLASSPMYLLGIDWGRWLSSMTISYLLILFVDARASLSPPDLLRVLPRAVRARIAKWLEFSPQRASRALFGAVTRRRITCLVLALFFCLTFRSPECCMKVGSPFYRLKPMVMEVLKAR
ncbi:hypothetical protein [Paraburkholderia phosphatilytica]|uniref:hypothetical protein n=1 Tax=Paraburkholderia phosphatilytica TaxID=2282883 RepID=UPI000E4DD16B|nr:hypothetical protein [Paraburkholderia phosphatilytica]